MGKSSNGLEDEKKEPASISLNVDVKASPTEPSSTSPKKRKTPTSASRIEEGRPSPHSPSSAGKEKVDEETLDQKGPKKEKKNVDISEHLQSLVEVLELYNSSADPDKPSQSFGLTSEQAAKALETFGPNIMKPPKQVPWYVKWAICILNLFNILLIFSGVLCYIVYFIDTTNSVYIGAILIGVAILNGTIEFLQLQKSAKLLESFLDMVPRQCKLIREGKLQEGPAADLVPGDVVFVKMGDKIPADLRIFHATELKVDNSSLTGESDPQTRTALNSMKNPLEATNLTFNGTLCVAGEGFGIVIRTGDNTVLGQIAGMTAREKKRDSPLSQEIDEFVKIITFVAAISTIIFFVLGMTVKGKSLSYNINFAIGVFVSWVPEGLPATITTLLSISAKRMSKRNVLVKDLQGVETLGAITLLATDKTGTLTRNQMTATMVWTNMKMFKVDRYSSSEEEPLDTVLTSTKEIGITCILCSRAKFAQTNVPLSERSIMGDATEAGLLRFACGFVPTYDTIADDLPKVFEIPFNSENKWCMSIHKKPHKDGTFVVYFKGAPERILRICSSIHIHGKPVPKTDEHEKAFQDAYEFMASKGHRVLAFAELELPNSNYPPEFEFKKDPPNYPKDQLCFMGLVSLEDPPKHGVREAIGKCRQAGIRVIMVTGDHPLTAEAIGRKINLMLKDTKAEVAKKRGVPESTIGDSEYDSIVVHGEQIDDLNEEDWDMILSKEEIIFARTSPKHKLLIVKKCQDLGHIVGVTGDGVNDSPALKKADLGISMNISGSDVSKEAATMILLDDNFASTVAGIEEGRLIFINLKKSIQYTITHTMPEVITGLLYVVVPVPLPMSTLLILFIDLGFELFIALSYAFEPIESRDALMKVPPRQPVTTETIKALRYRNRLRKELNRGRPTLAEGENETIGYKIRTSWFDFKQMFKLNYWKLKFQKKHGEVLVDMSVLSYAYLEVGLLETVGCFLTFFAIFYGIYGMNPSFVVNAANDPSNYFSLQATQNLVVGDKSYDPPTQYYILGVAQSAYYINLFIQQAVNAYMSKMSTRMPTFKTFFGNRYMLFGIGLSAALAAFFVYPPFMWNGIGTGYVPPLYWLIGIGMGIFNFGYQIVRILVRKRLNLFSTGSEGDIPLDMHPTVWSIK